VTEIVEAAVAVIVREDGRVLLGRRPEGKPWAGWWEFPGGKIEDGESPYHALQRELHEELGIEAETAYPWLTRTFAYPERTVKLRFFTVSAWHGEPHGRENQQLSWQDPSAISVSPLLPANAPVVDALRLPPVYAITNLEELGEQRFFEVLGHKLEQGLRLVQVRENWLAPEALAAFSARVIARCKHYGARVLLNGEEAMTRHLGADGVHFSSSRLMALSSLPDGLLCAASCHNAQELARAAELGMDFALLSPVMRTPSHPEIDPVGWAGFARMIEEYPLPVYALGGLQPADLSCARRHGAHGIAMQRAVWQG
jgi:8-oxo-dGTP diphosphatase